MDQIEIDFTVEHVHARAGLLKRAAANLDADKAGFQEELDDLNKSAPGFNNQYDAKVRIKRDISEIERAQALTEGRLVAAIALAERLVGVTDIAAFPVHAKALAREGFPADARPAGHANVHLGYAHELSEFVERLEARANRT